MKTLRKKENGSAFVAAVMLLFVVTIAILGYMTFNAYESNSVEQEIAEYYAYSYAEAGIQKTVEWIKNRSTESAVTTVPTIKFDDVEFGKGEATNLQILEVPTPGDPDKQKYVIESTGLFYPHKKNMRVERKLRMSATMNDLSLYLYFTDRECSPPWESPALSTVRFWRADKIYGRLRTNDVIRIRSNYQGPHFYNTVQSAANFMEIISDDGHQPVFHKGYELEVYSLEMSFTADLARKNALHKFTPSQLTDQYGNELKVTINFKETGWMTMVRNYVNSNPIPQDPNIPDTVHTRTPGAGTKSPGSIYVYGIAEVSGRVRGDVTVAAMKNIRILDDIVYADSDMSTMSPGQRGKPPPGCRNYLGLLSEQNVLIANTHANRTDPYGICINAGIVALGDGGIPGSGDWNSGGGSFTVENMNKSAPVYTFPYMQHRINLTVWGAIAQRYRGYVHRTNSYGEADDGGYMYKDYNYDERFNTHSPPDYVSSEKDYGIYALREVPIRD